MKVRIGNDICLYVNLVGNANFEAVNINSINAYLINTTKWQDLMDEQYRDSSMMLDEMERRKDKIKYVSRFPVEPHFVGFHPTPYDICCTGRPCYGYRPMPYVPVYPGYGVYPHTFEPHTWENDDMMDIMMRAGHKHMDIQAGFDRCRFLAPVEATETKNKVKVFFPAESQLYTGTYKLLIVAKLYDPGYNHSKLRTVTIDYENVFTLVSRSEDGRDGNITIYVNDKKMYPQDIVSISSSSEYTLQEGVQLAIGDLDYLDKQYKLTITLSTGNTVLYDPEDWQLGSITFESSNPSVVAVSENYGTLTAKPNSRGQSAVISVYNNQHQLLKTFVVHVVNTGSDYIVFIPSNNVLDVHNYIFNNIPVSGAAKYLYDSIFGTHSLNNPSDGNYMWICSRIKIADSNTISSNMSMSLFDVPLMYGSEWPKQVDGDHLYYYMCPNTLEKTPVGQEFDITVEPN